MILVEGTAGSEPGAHLVNLKKSKGWGGQLDWGGMSKAEVEGMRGR